jgi:hypothetical protein
MQDMYIRLTKLHEVINKNKNKKYNIENIKDDIKKRDLLRFNNNIIKESSDSYEILKSGNIGLQYSCIEENGDIKFVPKEEELPNPDYNTLRVDFIKCMKYTLFLYSKTIGRIDNIKYLKTILVNQSFDNDSITEKYMKEIINKRIFQLVNDGKFNYTSDSTINKYIKDYIKGTQELDYSIFKDVDPSVILTDEDYVNIYDYYIDYYFYNNSVDSDRYIIYIYTKILIRKIKNSPFFVIIRTNSLYNPTSYYKKLKIYDEEKTFYIRILNDKMRKDSNYTNHFNLIISKQNSYFNNILKECQQEAYINDFIANDEALARSLAGEKIVTRNQVHNELTPAQLLEQTKNDAAIARSLLYNSGGKRIQAKTLHKREKVMSGPKKPSPKKPSPKKPSPKKPSPKKPSPKKPSPKKPCKSKQKSRLT